jgi:hypothetical protein
MGGNVQELLSALKTLRAGRGIDGPELAQKLGPDLRALCGIGAADPPGLARQKVADRLGALADSLPPDLATAARAALALHPQARHQFLQDRTAWLAAVLDRDSRTARRRMDEALRQLAELAGAAAETPAANGDAYYIEEFRALLRLDRPTPEAHERRTVVANADGVRELDSLLTLPRGPATGDGPPDLDVEVLYGVTMTDRERATESRFRYGLRLTRLLRAGERHEYGLLFRIPPAQAMRTHYVFTSHRRCDAFDLRIRFDPDRLPSAVHRVAQSYPRDLDDAPADVPITLDDAGELHLRFTDLLVGRGYGVRWTDPE